MEKIIKKRIREQIYSETQRRPFTIEQIFSITNRIPEPEILSYSDEISIWTDAGTDSESYDGSRIHILRVFRWREETDEELQIRVDGAKQTMPDTIIAVSAKEYKELKEIKNKC